jgi:putative endopeptidase
MRILLSMCLFMRSRKTERGAGRPTFMVLAAPFALLAGLTTTVWAQRTPGFDILSLDKSGDPCQNFYQYSCGGWMKANPLPSDQARWGRFDVLQDRNRTILQNLLETASADKPTRTAIEQKIGDYYFACMDQKTIDAKAAEPLKAEIARIAALTSKKDLPELLAHMIKTGSGPFLRIASEPDAKNSAQIIAGVDQGGLGMPDRDYYLKTDDKSVEIQKKYLAYLTKVFELLGATPADAAKRAQVVMALETELAKGSLDRVSRRDPEKMYHKMPLADVQALTPALDWKMFLQGLGTPPMDSVDVAVPDFFKVLNTVISQTSLEDIKIYLQAVLVRDNADALASPFEQANFEFYGKVLSGTQEMRPRWKRCVDQVDNGLPDALGQKFIDKTLGAEGKRRTKEMLAGIEKAMEADLKMVPWMTPKTRAQALVKLHAVMNKIGDKAHWLDYATVKISRDDEFGNSMRTSEFGEARDFSKIGKPADKTEWQMSQPTVNAYYEPQENSVNFPAGILQPPFWDNKLDDAVNYGAIGAVIGHELTHGFDDQGRQFDAKGNLQDWWTEDDAKEFKQRAQCLVDQYGGYEAVPGVHLNGQLTLGENTADNGGVRLSYMALLDRLGKDVNAAKKIDGFTPQQRFFLAFAQVWCQNVADEDSRRRAQIDPHSPGEYRVNGVVSNMPEFKQAFGCKEGQPMAPQHMCRVW